MKAAFALLANTEIQNWVRKLAWEMHQKYRTGTLHCCLLPHVSLKQPFAISDLVALEDYMAELANSITPFEVSLTGLRIEPTVFEGREYGILWLDVQATEYLHQLHRRVNQELSQRFGNTQANFDGDDYEFHMTVMMGGQTMDVYRQLYCEISDRKINFRFTVSELTMFVYDEPMGPKGEYMSYKTLPIGRSST